MLDERRIERYARQILLPGVGGAGQERLLAASVEIEGRPEDTRWCAAWLAGAGVGRIALPRGIPGDDPMVARNPDVLLVTAIPEGVPLRIGVGCLPPETTPGTALLWGGQEAGALRWARLAPSRGCPGCRMALPAWAPAAPGSRMLLSTLLATEALRTLLGLASTDAAEAFRLDPSAGVPVREPFPFGRGCPACAATD